MNREHSTELYWHQRNEGMKHIGDQRPVTRFLLDTEYSNGSNLIHATIFVRGNKNLLMGSAKLKLIHGMVLQI
ncbi:hypothetical protein MUK42_28642 [Musa troglodytarum]|uniref:Uncharacterized protein n=1 Tax=Musa troglodytarum TaxID=320322 RepID=A0A9E7KJI5_9LILI|nr:hypothetical protein MUK42_28642 [Musa troglodytarum]